MNGEEDETMVGYIFLHCAICFSAFALWMVGRNVVGNFSPLILFMVRRKRAIVIAHRRHFLLERGRENERNIDRQASQSKR